MNSTMNPLKPVKLIKVRIPYTTAFGVQMQNSRFPISIETARHIELIVPETNERVIFSRKEVII